MTKLILTLIVGVFLGAFAVELMSRRRSKMLHRTTKRAKAAADEFREAFAEGFAGAP